MKLTRVIKKTQFKNGYSQRWELTVEMDAQDCPAQPIELLAINRKYSQDISSIDIMPLLPPKALELIIEEYEEESGIDWSYEYNMARYDDVHVEHDR